MLSSATSHEPEAATAQVSRSRGAARTGDGDGSMSDTSRRAVVSCRCPAHRTASVSGRRDAGEESRDEPRDDERPRVPRSRSSSRTASSRPRQTMTATEAGRSARCGGTHRRRRHHFPTARADNDGRLPVSSPRSSTMSSSNVATRNEAVASIATRAFFDDEQRVGQRRSTRSFPERFDVRGREQRTHRGSAATKLARDERPFLRQRERLACRSRRKREQRLRELHQLRRLRCTALLAHLSAIVSCSPSSSKRRRRSAAIARRRSTADGHAGTCVRNSASKYRTSARTFGVPNSRSASRANREHRNRPRPTDGRRHPRPSDWCRCDADLDLAT